MRSAAVQNPGPGPLQKFRPPEAGQKILVAVSGGVDSMVLLFAFNKFSAEYHWKLVVGHFNHQLRGRASDGDEAFVRKTATAMKLPFVAGRADVKTFAKGSKLSIEMAARKLRHEFLAKTAKDRKIRTVALAHHADDQVELFFLRLLRGAGGGLAGMKWRSPSPTDKGISLVRPLLDFSKAELEQIARESKIRHREDSMNFSTDILRNRIRHELLPSLRKNYQPALGKTILRVMEIVGAESKFAGDVAQAWLRGGKKDFEKIPAAVQRQVLKAQLIKLGATGDFEVIESLRRSANLPIPIIANLTVSRDANGRVAIQELQRSKFDAHEFVLPVNKPGLVVFDGVRLNWRLSRQAKIKFVSNTSKSGTEYFDADKMNGRIVLRHWRAGDRFRPIGMKASVKLQDLFTNLKIPRMQRHKLVIAESAGEIFWVEGLRISENFKLTPQTSRMLVWTWRR
jgi:tRNA(Ile)-lysidine synthase